MCKSVFIISNYKGKGLSKKVLLIPFGVRVYNNKTNFSCSPFGVRGKYFIMLLGIIGAMPEEMNKIISAISNKEIIERGSRIYYRGELFGQQVVAVFSRWGKVASATTVTNLILEFQVDRIVFTGVAGAISPDLNVGDIASGDLFISSSEMKNALLRNLPSVACAEMEGAAVAQVCDDYSVPLVVVRVISDSADEEAHTSAIGFVNQHAGDYSLSIIKEYIQLLQV